MGARIRARRLDLGLRQAELAADVGISAPYLNLIEHDRRRIGGRLLVALARALGVSVQELAEGAEAGLVTALGQAAAAAPGAPPADAAGLAARFPDWARLVAGQQARIGGLEAALETLSDRLTHDPRLAAALHEVLSTVTAIRSTAAILNEERELAQDWLDRFHANIDADARRLAGSARALVAYLEGEGGGAGTMAAPNTPQEEFEAWLAGGVLPGRQHAAPARNDAAFPALSGALNGEAGGGEDADGSRSPERGAEPAQLAGVPEHARSTRADALAEWYGGAVAKAAAAVTSQAATRQAETAWAATAQAKAPQAKEPQARESQARESQAQPPEPGPSETGGAEAQSPRLQGPVQQGPQPQSPALPGSRSEPAVDAAAAAGHRLGGSAPPGPAPPGAVRSVLDAAEVSWPGTSPAGPAVSSGVASGAAAALAEQPEALSAGLPEGPEARALALSWLALAREDAALIALPQLGEPDPLALAAASGQPLPRVFRRLAAEFPDWGLVSADAAGALLFRKPPRGFLMPRLGAACALWPLFLAPSRPLQAFCGRLEQAGRVPRRFRYWAVAEPVAGTGLTGPAVFRAHMLLAPEAAGAGPGAEPVGTSCRICPRPVCPARREASVLPG